MGEKDPKRKIRKDNQSNNMFQYPEKINEEEFLENVGLLFNDSNEESIIRKVDECSLLDEIRLPSVNINNKTSEEFLDTNIIEAFDKYQKKIPKTRKALTPAYWEILDLTEESLINSGINDMDIEKLSQDFSNKIRWDRVTTPKEIQEYFDGNDNVNNIDAIKKLDRNIQFMIDKMPRLRETCTKEELIMSTTFPLFSGIFNSPNINNSWGEIQANKARNEEQNPFTKARVGLKVDMKGTLVKTPNKFAIIYGVISGGVELSFYAMDWIGSGIYRFGKLDMCELPVHEDYISILEDAYCILRLLESKSLESEKIIKEILQNNTKNKRRRMITESNPK
ncbi:hypothetical protein C2G38_2212751 [Gigaspora rosea]|uniref:Uncharacterized protein n=1 Tax=Gigaspora rosea TaxID=44941 RepID=A0A397UCL1_9GLOM|nr:hypothetical protein C2G38_2212751 [Gigaspora rosea]